MRPDLEDEEMLEGAENTIKSLLGCGGLGAGTQGVQTYDPTALMKGDTTNPKDLIGVKKVPLGLLPAAGKIYGALAMKDGAKKYEPYNWRDKKVRYTIYLDAMERHLLALRDREDFAQDSKVPHLGHIIACASILADAIDGGFIIDDRPLPGPAARMLEMYKEGK